MIIKGNLELDIFKTVDGKKIKIGSFEDSNKITLSGKQVMAYLMAGEPGNHKVSKFGVGDGTAFPDDYDVGLSNAYIRHITGYNFLDPTIVQWQIALDAGEANGLSTISEFGLYSEEEQLFARKIRTPGVPNDSSISLSGYWTVWLMECKRTTFFSYAVFHFNISSPIFDYTNEVGVAPVIEHSITSSGNSERVIAAQADIVSDITSQGNTDADFASTAGIVSDITDPVIDNENVERRFSVSPNVFVEIQDWTLIWIWGDFMTQADIGSDIGAGYIDDVEFESNFIGGWTVIRNDNSWLNVYTTILDYDTGSGSPGFPNEESQIKSDFTIGGEFDIQIDFDVYRPAGATGGNNLGMWMFRVSDNRNICAIEWQKVGDPRFNAIYNHIDYDEVFVGADDNKGVMRLTRGADGFPHVFYDIGAGWEWDGDPNGFQLIYSTMDELYIRLEFFQGNGNGWAGNMSNFLINDM
jgi:hypothetical protein